MSIEIVSYQPTSENEWDAFVEKEARNSTFLHTRKFFNHNPSNALDDSSLLFYKNRKLIGVLPAAITGAEKRILHSHPRSTYGGFVVSHEVGAEEAVDIVKATINFGREHKVNSIRIRNPFRFFNRVPTDESDYAMWLNGFTLRSRELELALSLRGVVSEDQVFALMDGKTRNQVRKAQKLNVVIKETDRYEEFWRLLTQNLQDAHQTSPTHDFSAFTRLRGLVPANAIKLFGAFYNEEFVAGMVLFLAPPQAVHVQYIASDRQQSHLCAVNALVSHVATWAAKGSFDILNLGLSTEDEGRKMNLGLFKFKEGFGAHGVLRETMELQLEYK